MGLSREGSHLYTIREDLPLSAREEQIVALMAEGLTNSEIAIQLEITVQTVKNHCTMIYRKMRVLTRTGAVAKYVRGQEDK